MAIRRRIGAPTAPDQFAEGMKLSCVVIDMAKQARG